MVPGGHASGLSVAASAFISSANALLFSDRERPVAGHDEEPAADGLVEVDRGFRASPEHVLRTCVPAALSFSALSFAARPRRWPHTVVAGELDALEAMADTASSAASKFCLQSPRTE